MTNNDMETRQANKDIRWFFDNNKMFVTEGESFKCPGLTMSFSNDFLFYDTGTIRWNNKIYNMDEKTKKFMMKLRRDLQRSKDSKLYNIWFYWKEWILIGTLALASVGMGVAVAASCSLPAEQNAPENNVSPKKNTESSLDLSKARNMLDQQRANLIRGKNR